MQERLAAEDSTSSQNKYKISPAGGWGCRHRLLFDNIVYTFQRLPQKNDHCACKPLPASQTLSLLKQKNTDHLIIAGQELKDWLTHLLLFHTVLFILSLWANQLINMPSIITD